MNKRIRFTVRPRIQEEESLFGFLLRCSSDNGVPLCDILNRFRISRYRLHSGDFHKIDFIPEGMINLGDLSFVAGALKKDLISSTFYNIILKFKGSSKDHNSMFIKEYFRKHLFYCPDCFKEKSILRLCWKLEPITICEKHQRMLLETCHYCHEKIQYKDMKEIGICPYCLNDLSKSKSANSVSNIPDQILADQKWYESAFSTLLNKYLDIQLHQGELAMRILYVLNGCKNEFNRKESSKKITEATLVHYLQCARGTTHKSSLHLRNILSILKEQDMEVGTFLELEVPTAFKSSILNPDGIEKKAFKCMAPWCISYGLEERLLTTSSKNIQSHGQMLKQYYVCPDCGCEYASDANNNLIERTYFIKGYDVLIKRNIKNLTWPEREKLFGLKRGKILRIISYFSSRTILNEKFKYSEKDVDYEKLANFIESIESGTDIYDIRNWSNWGSYEYYLLYRYHPKVIKAIVTNNNQPISNIIYDRDLAFQIKNVCNRMIENNDEIKLMSVAKSIECSVATIRNKGCSAIVGEYRMKQQEIFKQELIQRFDSNINEFFMQHEGGTILSKELFENNEVCRNTIRKIQPEFCKQIDARRLEWNKQQRMYM